MKHFLVLYLAPVLEREEMMKNLSQEEIRKIVASWRVWKEENQASLVDGGSTVGKTRQSDINGITDIKNEIDSYSIVQADSHEEAMKLFGPDHPHFSSGLARIEVSEIAFRPR